jgi:hypothetical protein
MENTITNYYSAEKETLEKVAFEDLLISKSLSGFGVVSNVEVLKYMNNILQDSGLEASIDKLYAKNNLFNGIRGIEIDNDSIDKFPPMLSQTGGTLYDPRSLRFNRLAGSFKINSLANKESYGFIGFATSNKGYELAIGSEIAVCSNMCVMQADHRASTFGNAKIGDVTKLMNQLRNWISTYPEIRESNIETIARMKEIVATPKLISQTFGELYEMTHKKGGGIIGANTLSKTQSYYVKEFIEKDNSMTNIWDLYNLFTYHMKFDTLDFLNIFESNQKISEYLLTIEN